MLDRILGRTAILEKALDASMLKNEAISQNISNVDTPNFKRKKVDFEEVLKEEIQKSSISGIRTNDRHISIGEPNIQEVEIKLSEDNSFNPMRLDGNNVDIDSEMSLLAKNSLQYNMLVQRINSSFRSIKSVIADGRK